MARCPKCYKKLRITLEDITDSFQCDNCSAGPLSITRLSGYIYALGIAGYFIVVLVLGVAAGVDPSDMFGHIHNSANQSSFAAVLALFGFFIWLKVWGGIWSSQYAKLRP